MEIPVPIPNTEVKHSRAENSASKIGHRYAKLGLALVDKVSFFYPLIIMFLAICLSNLTKLVYNENMAII